MTPIDGTVTGARSTDWNDVVAPGEAEQFARFAREINAYQEGFARRGDGVPRRGFHVKTHAGVSAEFTVLADIPDEAKHGVFRTAKTFPAWVRITNGFSAARSDVLPDLVGFAVKLTGVDGPKLLDGEEYAQTRDFLALNQPSIPASTAAQLMIISLSSANLLTAPFALVRGVGLPHALRIVAWTLRWSLRRVFLRSVATEHYSSGVPIALGPYAVKFTWRPRQTPARASRAGFWDPNRLRSDLLGRLEDGDVSFDFLVQFYTDPRKTPLDDASAWNESDAPFAKLAELTIRRRDLDAPQAQSEQQYVDSLSFNPWHAVADHRPIGNIQRGRAPVYRASALYRKRADDPTDAASPA